MSILDPIDVQLERGDRMIAEMQRIEEELSVILAPGFVNCVPYSSQSNQIHDKIAEVYGLPKSETTFAQKLQTVLDKSLFELTKHKGRRIISLNIRDLKKGDAYGFMKTLSEQIDDLILVLENVTRIPEGNPAIYDDKLYIENLLIRSWKNKRISAGELDFMWDRFTIILTCPPEDRNVLMNHCRMCSYGWDEALGENLN